ADVVVFPLGWGEEDQLGLARLLAGDAVHDDRWLENPADGLALHLVQIDLSPFEHLNEAAKQGGFAVAAKRSIDGFLEDASCGRDELADPFLLGLLAGEIGEDRPCRHLQAEPSKALLGLDAVPDRRSMALGALERGGLLDLHAITHDAQLAAKDTEEGLGACIEDLEDDHAAGGKEEDEGRLVPGGVVERLEPYLHVVVEGDLKRRANALKLLGDVFAALEIVGDEEGHRFSSSEG